MTDTFGMPQDVLKRAVDDQLTRPSAINEQGFFGGIPLSYYERIIVKRDRGPASTAAQRPRGVLTDPSGRAVEDDEAIGMRQSRFCAKGGFVEADMAPWDGLR